MIKAKTQWQMYEHYGLSLLIKAQLVHCAKLYRVPKVILHKTYSKTETTYNFEQGPIILDKIKTYYKTKFYLRKTLLLNLKTVLII